MTYLELSDYLHKRACKSSEVCFQTVTVRVGDEYYPVTKLVRVNTEQDVLDPGHLILVVDD